MKLSDLKPLDIVKIRDGRILIVLENSLAKTGLGLFDDVTGCVVYFDNYTEECLYDADSSRDIVKVYKDYTYSKWISLAAFFKHEINDMAWAWTWVRKEPLEVTMAEIEKKFGCKVKIVKE